MFSHSVRNLFHRVLGVAIKNIVKTLLKLYQQTLMEHIMALNLEPNEIVGYRIKPDWHSINGTLIITKSLRRVLPTALCPHGQT